MEETVRVGILHSLSGTMAISEQSLKDAQLMAIAQINAAGGVLGKQIEPIVKNGDSHPATFAHQARQLLQQDGVTTLFGGWTSACRKAVLPVLEEFNALLWYPVEYEGLECSRNIFYTGLCPNQQVEPAVNWLLQNKGKRFYLVGSDYVFPRTVSKLIKAQLKHLGGSLLGEEYTPLGATQFTAIIERIQQVQPDVVLSTLNGDSNLAFYQQYKAAGITPEQIPIMAISVAEEELRRMAPEVATGHYAAWSYFQSLDLEANQTFVQDFQQQYGQNRVTSDSIQSAYVQVFLWKQAVESAQSFEVDCVRQAAYGQTFNGPSGLVKIEQNHHLWKPCRIGKIQANGQFEVVYTSDGLIKPLPWLGIEELEGRVSPVIIDMLAEVSQAIEYSCRLEQKSREVEIANTELLAINERLQQTQAQLRCRTNQFRKLVQQAELLKRRLSSQIRNSLDINTIVGTAVTEIRELLQIDRCQFFWCRTRSESQIEEAIATVNRATVSSPFASPYLADNQRLRRETGYQFELSHESYHSTHQSSADRSLQVIEILGDKILEQNLLKLDEIETTYQLEETSKAMLVEMGLRSLLAITVQTRSGDLGIVVCQHESSDRPWNMGEVELLNAVADQIASAIDQAKLYEESRRTAALATAQAEELQQALHNLQQTQAQLIQTEKLSGLGHLLAGVAHEINNPVSFIYGNLTFANEYARDLLTLVKLYQEHYPQPLEPIQEYIETVDLEFLMQDFPQILSSMKVGADRIRDLVLSLRNFSRSDQVKMQEVDLHEGIESTLLILQNQLKPKPHRPAIQVIKEFGDLPLVECYAGQMNQVFMNILSNAIDALEESLVERPLSVIATNEKGFDNGKSKREETLAKTPTIWIRTQAISTHAVSICIADNGLGMPDKTRQQLFDPFFTTKPVGKGTGLGLSISYKIVVEKHNGQLDCESKPGQGTTFMIEIPVSQEISIAVSPVHENTTSPV